MGKRSLALFALLFVFWIVISGTADWQHILTGLIISFIGTAFWHTLGPRLPSLPHFGETIRLFHALFLLVGYIIFANIDVAKILLFSKPALSPVFIVMETNLKKSWSRVLLAACITITPGTITVDVEPDTGRFIVHALTEKNAVDLLHWRLIDKIKDIENWRGEKGA